MRAEPPARYRQSIVERPLATARAVSLATAHGLAQHRAPARSLAQPRSSASRSRWPCCSWGSSFIDVMNLLINHQFFQVDAAGRDALVRRAAIRRARVTTSVHLPGVMDVEPIRAVPVRLRAGHRIAHARHHRPAGVARISAAWSIARGGALTLPPRRARAVEDAGDILDVRAGDLAAGRSARGHAAGARRCRWRRCVDDSLGLQAYMRIDAVHRLLREGATVTGAAITLDPGSGGSVLCGCQDDAGGGRRGASRDDASATSARRWPRT